MPYSSSNQKGFAALVITLIILAIMFGIAMPLIVLVLGQQRIVGDLTKSNQAYFAAEAGIEDTLLRLSKRMNWSTPYSFNIGKGTVEIGISDFIGGSRTITAKGNVSNRIKKVSVVYGVSTEKIAFHYGAHVGRGGMIMEANSKIIGNVFSNGSVACSDPLETAFITNSLIVARNGQKIERLEIGEPGLPTDEAHVHICSSSTVHGTLYYVSPGLGGSKGDCVADDGFQEHPNIIEERLLPISDTQIQVWEDEASCDNDPACIYVGDYTIPIGVSESLGPLKIEGNLALGNNATLKMTGTVYVTGNIIINQNATIELDPNYYGVLSGIVIADGKITVENNATIEGSGQPGSYTMLLSTNSSLDKDDAAIHVKNNAMGAIFYTTDGIIRLGNNMKIREATGYKLYLDNNAEIEYETGLEDTTFTSGPGGSWAIISWREIE